METDRYVHQAAQYGRKSDIPLLMRRVKADIATAVGLPCVGRAIVGDPTSSVLIV
jgi:hypothetical protein